MEMNELIELATLPDNEKIVLLLLEKIGLTEIQDLRPYAEQFDALLEKWSEDITHSTEKAEVVIKLADKGILDTPAFRSALHYAVRKLLPPYLASGSVVKALGAKDPAVSIRDVAHRFHKLQNLRSTALVYQQETHQWGKITGIDKLTGTIGVAGLETSGVSSVPVASAVLNSYFFNLTPDFLNLLYPGKFARVSSNEYRAMFAKNTLAELPEAKVKEIVSYLMVPEVMDEAGFEAWWTCAEQPAQNQSNKRFYADARSVLELYTLLPGTKEAEKDKDRVNEVLTPMAPSSAEKLEKLFTRLYSSMPSKEVTMLMECVAILGEPETEPALLRSTFAPLRGKVPFWPAVVNEKLTLEGLEYWGHISVKLLGGLVKATSMLYTQEELAILGTRLPLRCIGPVMSRVSSDILNETILKMKLLSSDLILWIWKNPGAVLPRLAEAIDMGCVVNALSVESLPREWTAAQRELKKNTFEKKQFQQFLIDNAQGDIPSISSAVQRCRVFVGGERQSLLVKLASLSPELMECLESGEGRRILGNSQSSVEQATITSVVSYQKKAAELENLINVLIPENAAAVALARSYGDLRENAEYDAAKEQRRFLHKRRSELEKEINTVQSTDFKDVTVADHVVPGSVVKLEAASGDVKEYYLLGAWDGDPEKNRISYKTRIGEALVNRKVGDKVQIPEAGAFTVQAVLPLPADLLKELAGENA
ncbi:MAG: GreA/GreB family elongation factor [Lentisphaeria bacterium]|nr:GreA/GreB family elongation factor [Lentisphaeria bacterium]